MSVKIWRELTVVEALLGCSERRGRTFCDYPMNSVAQESTFRTTSLFLLKPSLEVLQNVVEGF